MRNAIYAIGLAWMLIVVGFKYVGLSMGWSIILSTLLMVLLGAGGYAAYKKWFDRGY